MNGHPAPRRKPAAQSTLFRACRPISLVFLLLLAWAVAGVTTLSGCGSSGAATASSTTVAVTSSTTPSQASFPVTVTDDANNSVTIDKEPLRIVSTAPSNTEILFALGLGEKVVGVSSLDDYPPEAAKIPKVGDFQVNTEAVLALSPDVVLGYAGNEEALTPVKKAGIPVLIFNPDSLEQIYSDIETVGQATAATTEASALVSSIRAEVQAVADTAGNSAESPKVFYALDNTLYTAGPGSFVDALLTLAHCTNVADGATAAPLQAYYQFAPEQLVAADPDVILLPKTAYKSAEDFASDPRFAGLKAVKNGRVIVIDDVIVTRPGPRIGQGLKLLAAAIHPEAF